MAQDREKANTELEKRVLALLLSLVDGISDKDQVIIIGATSLPDNIDKAFRRFGRLDKEIILGQYDASQRQEILKINT